MARSFDKVFLIGNLGFDPEVRYIPNGTAVTNLRIATSKRWKDKQTGETQEKTKWHRVVLFGRLAEVAGQYLRKGSKVWIEGELNPTEWEKEGQKHYSYEIIANDMLMLDSRQASPWEANKPGVSQARPSQSFSPPEHSSESNSFDDDDIPF